MNKCNRCPREVAVLQDGLCGWCYELDETGYCLSCDCKPCMCEDKNMKPSKNLFCLTCDKPRNFCNCHYEGEKKGCACGCGGNNHYCDTHHCSELCRLFNKVPTPHTEKEEKKIIHCPKCAQIDKTSEWIPEGWKVCTCSPLDKTWDESTYDILKKQKSDIIKEKFKKLIYPDGTNRPIQDFVWDEITISILLDFFASELTSATIKAKEKQKIRIGMMRQWLNEDRITDVKKMVSNEDLEYWLNLEEPKS